MRCETISIEEVTNALVPNLLTLRSRQSETSDWLLAATTEMHEVQPAIYWLLRRKYEVQNKVAMEKYYLFRNGA